MELSYWQSRWQKENTGWHMDTVYPPLPHLWDHLGMTADARVLVPLCGKSLDLLWLADHCDTVTGVEVSPKALQHLMQQHNESFLRENSHGFTVYRSDSLVLWEGDFAKLPADQIPPQDLIYDKASIIALPAKKRQRHAEKIIELSNADTQILVQTFEYDQSEMNGPPFSVDEQELKKLFAHRFNFKCIHEQSKLEELQEFKKRGLSSYLTEKIFHLTPSNRG
jgi:thiopurine S-methyltransferase